MTSTPRLDTKEVMFTSGTVGTFNVALSRLRDPEGRLRLFETEGRRWLSEAEGRLRLSDAEGRLRLSAFEDVTKEEFGLLTEPFGSTASTLA